ncbi:MAG: glycosyltransferase [Candidatus Gracilibacteria bacterium]|nr:glycosyltransferase [Candidatus Gracilibacteria bacterium]
MINIIELNKKLLIDNLKKIGLDSNSKILSFSIYNKNYTRTESIHNLFDSLNINYYIINYYPKNYFLRYFLSLFKLIKEVKNYDVVFVHFRGFEILPFIWIISKIFRKKIIFDHFISIWDTVCFDRGIIKAYGLVGRFLKLYDKILINLSDLVLLDTNSHLNFFIKELGLSESKGGYLYVGCNEELFKPLDVKKFNKFTIFWYGNVQPIQGVDFILNVAKKLENHDDIEFVLVGPILRKLGINKYEYKNIQFIEWLDYNKLPEYINKSHLCIGGHFSDIGKAKRVIAGKSFQFLSCGIPTILADNEANRELFKEGDENIYFSVIGNMDKIVNLILNIKNN